MGVKKTEASLSYFLVGVGDEELVDRNQDHLSHTDFGITAAVVNLQDLCPGQKVVRIREFDQSDRRTDLPVGIGVIERSELVHLSKPIGLAAACAHVAADIKSYDATI